MLKETALLTLLSLAAIIYAVRPFNASQPSERQGTTTVEHFGHR